MREALLAFEAREVGDLRPWEEGAENIPSEWRSAPAVQEPSESEYYAAIRMGVARDRKQERLARILAWQRSNDPLREASASSGSTSSPDNPEREQNIRSLIALLDDGCEDDLVMMAEAYRELGMRRQAEDMLSRVASPQYSRVVTQLLRFCGSDDSTVREFELHR